MKFLVMTDIHGNSSVLDKLDDEFKSCDAVLFGGDFADVIGKLPGEPVLEKLCSKHDEIYAVLGNHD
ncbi:metallophosphoesterase, partial [Treponema porcinum]